MSNETTAEQRPHKPARLGILISDDCAHCLAIAAAVRDGLMPDCEIAVVVSNVTGATGIDTARAAGLPVVVMEGRGRDQHDHESAISALLRTYRVDLVCLAGNLSELSCGFIRDWRGRTLAIHPSLLPAFPGSSAVEQALAYGVRYTGCTVFLAGDPDPAAILVQRVVPVENNDTAESLRARISHEEALAYPEAVRVLLSGGHQTRASQLLPHVVSTLEDEEGSRDAAQQRRRPPHHETSYPLGDSGFSEPAASA